MRYPDLDKNANYLSKAINSLFVHGPKCKGCDNTSQMFNYGQGKVALCKICFDEINPSLLRMTKTGLSTAEDAQLVNRMRAYAADKLDGLRARHVLEGTLRS